MKLNEKKLKILAYLSVIDDLQKSVKHIRKRFKLEYSYLCRILREMAEDGYLKRYEKNKARNSVVYDITEKGRKLITK